MQEGDSVEMKGPLPKFPYKANMKKKIGMVTPLSSMYVYDYSWAGEKVSRQHRHRLLC